MSDPSTFEAIATLVKDIGFPIFVAAWFVIRLEPRLKLLSDRILLLLERHSIDIEDVKKGNDNGKEGK